MKNLEKEILVWDTQREFKKFCKARLAKNFYFDGEDCVNAHTDRNVRGIRANGKLTFKQAKAKLEKYFA